MISLGFKLALLPHTEQENTKLIGPQLTEIANEIYEEIINNTSLFSFFFSSLHKTNKADC